MITKALLAVAVVTLCSGCVGIVTHGDRGYWNEAPVLLAKRARFTDYTAQHGELRRPTKAEVLVGWGKPNQIETPQVDTERWIYKEGIR